MCVCILCDISIIHFGICDSGLKEKARLFCQTQLCVANYITQTPKCQQIIIRRQTLISYRRPNLKFLGLDGIGAQFNRNKFQNNQRMKPFIL